MHPGDRSKLWATGIRRKVAIGVSCVSHTLANCSTNASKRLAVRTINSHNVIVVDVILDRAPVMRPSSPKKSGYVSSSRSSPRIDT
eukprot:1899605-Prymnesium_polylepis.1